jgi:hypothetical protein
MHPFLSEILIPAGIGALIILFSTGLVSAFLAMGVFIADKMERVFASREARRLDERSELYQVIQNRAALFNINKDDIRAIIDLRDSWYALKKLSHEEKLLLISAGYSVETAIKAFATLDIEALKVQAELTK